MNMSVDEICRNYRQAKDKKEQINIIADLNCTSKDEIIKVLVDCGEMEQPEEATKRKVKKKDEQLKEIPDAVAHTLFARIDELEKLIKPLEDQLKPLKNEYNEIVRFLGVCRKDEKT